jgi:hypothetical protein
MIKRQTQGVDVRVPDVKRAGPKCVRTNIATGVFVFFTGLRKGGQMPDDQIQRELVFHQSSLDGMERLAELYRKCFNTTPPTNYFSWKYRDNPSGTLLGFEATHNGKVVASYGVIPENYLVNGKRRVVWQSMDTMTDPEYQRRGLFISLAKMTFDHLETVDPTFLLLGIPGEASYPGFTKKLGWTDIHQFALMFQDRRAFAALSALRRLPKLTFRNVTGTAESLADYLSSRVGLSDHIQNELTTDFLTWRVLNNPMRSLRLVEFSEGGIARGITVFSKDESGKSFVFLLDTASPDQMGRLTPAVLKYIFSETGARVVSTWEPMDSRLRQAYARSGLVKNPTTKGPMLFKQPLIAYCRQSAFEGFNATSASSFRLQPIMQD